MFRRQNTKYCMKDKYTQSESKQEEVEFGST